LVQAASCLKISDDGQQRIAKISSVIEGLVELGLIDQERLSRARSVITTMRESQRLVEEHYQAVSAPRRRKKSKDR
jgi:hypothetical protein